ncbi:MAG: glycosyltransferase family 25 protein, partial [Isosphaeraceae bacterium]
MKLIEYFDRACVIHLPERTDRYEALQRELRPLGMSLTDPKVRIPFAPRPDDAHGYTSRGVFGSFLSHYNILKEALADGIQSVWVLEDDAIFSRKMVRDQERLVETLRANPWDLCFFGHSLTTELEGVPKGLVHHGAPFRWAHCYAVHARILPRLIAYLDETMARPVGHPEGGKVYIDAAYSLFRKLNPDVVSLVANPVLSLQKGCYSSLGGGHWYDRSRVTRPLVSVARSARDELWRRT